MVRGSPVRNRCGPDGDDIVGDTTTIDPHAVRRVPAGGARVSIGRAGPALPRPFGLQLSGSRLAHTGPAGMRPAVAPASDLGAILILRLIGPWAPTA